MSVIYRVGPGAPGVSLDAEKFARQVAVFVNNNNITSDGLLDTFIDGRTDAQIVAACRTLLKGIIKVHPP